VKDCLMEKDPTVKLRNHISKYKADDWLASKQLALGVGQWLSMMYLYSNGYIPFLIFVVFESLSLLHLFMIYHDMGHNSFFSSSSMNTWGEWFLQFLVFTPVDWSKKHKIHHGGSGDLNKGPTEWNDTIYFTTEEYWALSPVLRSLYRFGRDPLFFFTVIPVLNWFVKYRIPFLEMLDRAQRASGLGVAKNSIVNTTGVAIVFWAVWKAFGTPTTLAYIFTIYVCMAIGVMLFHLQHAFNPSFTTRTDWNLKDSAFKGSSILTIPEYLKTWTMGIEYHHIHHYSSIIPGYLLRKCHEEAPEGLWHGTTTLSPKEMYESVFYTLYDEPTGRYVSFKEADALEAQRNKKPKSTVNKKVK